MLLMAGAAVGALVLGDIGLLAAASARATAVSPPVVCRDRPYGPEYYAFPLITTKNVAGTGLAKGIAEVSFPGHSPYSVAVSADGSYEYDIEIRLERMKAPNKGILVAWVTTTDIDQVARIGALDERLMTRGSVSWNKFLVVITLEPADDPSAATWTGPIVFRGMSRSGMMHTMVGHGVLQQENCAAYGYGN